MLEKFLPWPCDVLHPEIAATGSASRPPRDSNVATQADNPQMSAGEWPTSTTRPFLSNSWWFHLRARWELSIEKIDRQNEGKSMKPVNYEPEHELPLWQAKESRRPFSKCRCNITSAVWHGAQCDYRLYMYWSYRGFPLSKNQISISYGLKLRCGLILENSLSNT